MRNAGCQEDRYLIAGEQVGTSLGRKQREIAPRTHQRVHPAYWQMRIRFAHASHVLLILIIAAAASRRNPLSVMTYGPPEMSSRATPREFVSELVSDPCTG